MKKTVWILLGVLFLGVAAFFGWKALFSVYTPRAAQSESYAPETVESEPFEPASAPEPDNPSEPEDAAEPSDDAAGEAPEAVTDAMLPDASAGNETAAVDFDALRAVNPDIYAWLVIPNSDISYPVVQSGTDDAYYLTHNSDGAYSANGAIFSEHLYNTTTFADPVTILYGHHMTSGAMFGNLQQLYSDAAFFEENPVITIYTPYGVLEYGVFAAVPYSSVHILRDFDFTDEDSFTGFFDGVFNVRSLSAQFREEYAPVYGDNVLILSTCLVGNNTNRFLVMGVLLSDR